MIARSKVLSVSAALSEEYSRSIVHCFAATCEKFGTDISHLKA